MFIRKFLLPILVVGGCCVLFWLVGGNLLTSDSRESLPPENAPVREPGVVTVTVVPVKYRPIQRSVVAVGTLFGYEEVTISAKVEGRVRKIHHDVADRVPPGEVIVEIDPTDSELAVRQAEKMLLTELAKLGLKVPPSKDFDTTAFPSVKQAKARLEKDEGQFIRAKKLAASGSLAQEVLDNATADFRVSQAEYANQLLQIGVVLESIKLKQAALAIAQQHLDDTFIRMPTPTKPIPDANGRLTYAITHRWVSEGSYVRVGGDVCKAAIDRPLKLRVSVPEHHNEEVKLGQKVDVICAAFAQSFDGTVARINPAIDKTNRTFEVEVHIANADGKLKPGGFARAMIHTRLEAKATTVPLEALVQFAGITKIFVAEGNRAKEMHVSLGVQSTDFVEITEPTLPAGAQVVINGQTALAENTPIAIRK